MDRMKLKEEREQNGSKEKTSDNINTRFINFNNFSFL